jgi:hypothetical protein
MLVEKLNDSKKMIMTNIRTYSELCTYDLFEDRVKYLMLGGGVGRATFGFDRYINQKFYKSYEWRNTRQQVVLRDNGCDLGVFGYEINHSLLIHHMNPMNYEDIVNGEEWIFDPEYLITTTQNTHNAIHYKTDIQLPKVVASRSRHDTKLW